ncbi:MAG: hypothetical protein U5J96_08355 [Ignavibacteriaceae bacterium]|nr:hypothetical protein [Ignavibacteriaceae bacterium]
MASFNKVLDLVMELPPGDRDTLLEIIKSRRIAERRKEIAVEVHESLAFYKSGKLVPQNADEVIQILNSLSEEKED